MGISLRQLLMRFHLATPENEQDYEWYNEGITEEFRQDLFLQTGLNGPIITAEQKSEKLKQNFISSDKTTAINSYGEIFSINDVVSHESTDDTAKITSFFVDVKSNEITANTTKGIAHIDFIYK